MNEVRIVGVYPKDAITIYEVENNQGDRFMLSVRGSLFLKEGESASIILMRTAYLDDVLQEQLIDKYNKAQGIKK